MQKVTVYHFTMYDENNDQDVRPHRMATLEFINSIGGTAIPISAKEVDLADIDEKGRYPIIKSTTD